MKLNDNFTNRGVVNLLELEKLNSTKTIHFEIYRDCDIGMDAETALFENNIIESVSFHRNKFLIVLR